VYHFLLFGIDKNDHTHLFTASCQFCSKKRKSACAYKQLRCQNSIQKNAVKAAIRRLTAPFGSRVWRGEKIHATVLSENEQFSTIESGHIGRSIFQHA